LRIHDAGDSGGGGKQHQGDGKAAAPQ
jgi:hypothetical protein